MTIKKPGTAVSISAAALAGAVAARVTGPPDIGAQLAATVPVVSRECGGVRDESERFKELAKSPQFVTDVTALCMTGKPDDVGTKAACIVTSFMVANEEEMEMQPEGEPIIAPEEPKPIIAPEAYMEPKREPQLMTTEKEQ